MFRLALTLLVLTALATAVTAGEGDGVIRKTFDVSAITTPVSSERVPLLGALVGSDGWQIEHEQWEDRVTRPPYLTGERLVEIVYSGVRPGVWEEVGVSLELRHDRLLVRHRPEIVREVEALLVQLAAAATQRVLLHVEVREGAAGVDGCRISGSVELPCGVLGSFAVTSRVDYVGDYDVEIAQASNISNPLHLRLDEGLAVEAIAHPLLDGRRVALELLLQFCCLEDMRRVELGLDEECFNKPFRSPERFSMGTVELPTCSHADAHVTLIVPTGEDVLLPVVHGERTADLRLHVELLGANPPPAFLGLGALVTPPLAIRAGGVESEYYAPLVTQRLRFHGGGAPAPMGSIEEVIELVHTAVSPLRWEEELERLDDLASRRQLLVTTRPDLQAQVRRFLEEREADALRPVVLDVAVLSTRDTVTPGPGRDLDPELTAIVTSGRLHTLSGRWASMRLGTTRNYLCDYDAEVAQEARIPDPVVGQSFGGLLANLRPHLPLGGRTARVDLDLLVTRHELAAEPFDSGVQYLGPIEQVRARRTRLETSIGVSLGGRTLLDAGPDPDHLGARLVVAISARIP